VVFTGVAWVVDWLAHNVIVSGYASGPSASGPAPGVYLLRATAGRATHTARLTVVR
jgi:hypothetical protein